MSDPEAMRREAQQDHWSNPQTQNATPQSINDAILRNEYNAALERQRQLEEQRRREHGGF